MRCSYLLLVFAERLRLLEYEVQVWDWIVQQVPVEESTADRGIRYVLQRRSLLNGGPGTTITDTYAGSFTGGAGFIWKPNPDILRFGTIPKAWCHAGSW